jgi:ribosomal protein S14
MLHDRALRKFGQQKFKHEACCRCGTPQSVVNGAWLRLQRELAGLTLREAARRIGFSAAYLCDVEYNRRHCTPKVRTFYESLAQAGRDD